MQTLRMGSKNNAQLLWLESHSYLSFAATLTKNAYLKTAFVAPTF